VTTVRELFRATRHAYRPRTGEEGEMVLALRQGDWKSAEFWMCMAVAAYLPKDGEHGWYFDGDRYDWVCRHCRASVPVDGVDAGSPPQKDEGCACKACAPCAGRS
jgi:hypothetical protein